MFDTTLRDAVCRAVERWTGGPVLIPAFAVDPTELVLLELGRLMGCRTDRREGCVWTGSFVRCRPVHGGQCRSFEAQGRFRITIVSPTVLTESKAKYAAVFLGFPIVDGPAVGAAHLRSVESSETGQVYAL